MFILNSGLMKHSKGCFFTKLITTCSRFSHNSLQVVISSSFPLSFRDAASKWDQCNAFALMLRLIEWLKAIIMYESAFTQPCRGFCSFLSRLRTFLLKLDINASSHSIIDRIWEPCTVLIIGKSVRIKVGSCWVWTKHNVPEGFAYSVY